MKKLKTIIAFALLFVVKTSIHAQVHDQKWSDIINKSEPLRITN